MINTVKFGIGDIVVFTTKYNTLWYYKILDINYRQSLYIVQGLNIYASFPFSWIVSDCQKLVDYQLN